ncbi:hypothetical protein LUZ60_013018 [Juncus effusus]|nr:hypothetical protein LUZ60_013018 [Juncus effusus]
MSLASCNFDQDNVMLASKPQCRRESQIYINGATFASSIQCGEKYEDEEKLRTVECLRGRLLAERFASKEAKEETEQLGKKLDELERNLNKEIKVRNRAEKRLRHALKKLESLKILNLSESSIGSISSYSSFSNEGSGEKTLSNDNSAQCSSTGEIKEVENEINGSKEIDLIGSFSHEESSSYIGTEMSQNGSNGSSKDSRSEEEFPTSVRQESSSVCTESDQQMVNEENKLAIVLVNNEPKKENVESVLLALRQVKEKLQYSIAKRSLSSMKEIYGQ